jgi:hypothetical protein
LPLFESADSTGYFDQSLYPRYRAQGLKEDMWAYQYYGILREASTPYGKYAVNTTAPSGMKVYAIMTYNAGNPSTDEASDEFYRRSKLDNADYIAGGNLTSPVIWCKEVDCSLLFPVNKPDWTAIALMSLGL